MLLRDQLPNIIVDSLPGPNALALLKRREGTVPNAIGCMYPCVIKRGSGAMIEDVDGNVFLDWIGGVGVLNVGHSHPKLVKAVQEQAENYFHGMFNMVTHEGYLELSEKISKIAPVRGNEKKTFFANSGAEADENAIKVAKAVTKRPNIIVFSGGFHGRTLLTMTMTAKKAYSKGLGPFPDGVYRAEFPYLYRRPESMTEQDAIAFYVERFRMVFEESSPAELVAAVVIEPLQGEGGFIPAPIEYIKAIRKICDEHGILLIADEVQTGFARCGRMFASNYWKEAGCEPDILAIAKSIAGGVPLSGVVASKELMDAVPKGLIGGTYGGNALACAAAIQVLDVIEEENLVIRAQEIGEICLKRFGKWLGKYPFIGDVRGLGAMIGIEFVKDKRLKIPNPELVTNLILEAAQKGLLIENAGTYGNVVRFLAPLVITNEQLEAGFTIMENIMNSFMED